MQKNQIKITTQKSMHDTNHIKLTFNIIHEETMAFEVFKSNSDPHIRTLDNIRIAESSKNKTIFEIDFYKISWKHKIILIYTKNLKGISMCDLVYLKEKNGEYSNCINRFNKKYMMQYIFESMAQSNNLYHEHADGAAVAITREVIQGLANSGYYKSSYEPNLLDRIILDIILSKNIFITISTFTLLGMIPKIEDFWYYNHFDGVIHNHFLDWCLQMMTKFINFLINIGILTKYLTIIFGLFVLYEETKKTKMIKNSYEHRKYFWL